MENKKMICRDLTLFHEISDLYQLTDFKDSGYVRHLGKFNTIPENIYSRFVFVKNFKGQDYDVLMTELEPRVFNKLYVNGSCKDISYNLEELIRFKKSFKPGWDWHACVEELLDIQIRYVMSKNSKEYNDLAKLLA